MGPGLEMFGLGLACGIGVRGRGVYNRTVNAIVIEYLSIEYAGLESNVAITALDNQ